MGQALSLLAQQARRAARRVQNRLLGVAAHLRHDDSDPPCKDGAVPPHVISVAHVTAATAAAAAAAAAEGLTPAGNPLPPVVHACLTTDPSKGSGLQPEGRVIVVGDVHGCVAELVALLEGLAYRQGVDVVVLAGDLVTKGPDSRQVLQLARLWGLCSVRGNHDDASLAAHAAWRRGEPIEPRFDFVKTLAKEDVAYLDAMPFSLSFPEFGVTVVHAGRVPGVPLQRQPLCSIYTMRLLVHRSDGVWEPYDGEGLTPLGAMPWASCWPGPQHVFFGHDHPRGLQLTTYATGIDTGCYDGGALTAAVLPPLDELRRSEIFCRKLKAGEPLTFEDLQGRIVSMPSLQPSSNASP